jgi:polysaccharide export outer membrane protein
VAGGYTYRANTKKVLIRRAGKTEEQAFNVENTRVLIFPGDNIRVPERFF